MKFITNLEFFFYILWFVIYGDTNLVSTIKISNIENSRIDYTSNADTLSGLNEFLQEIPDYNLIKIAKASNSGKSQDHYYNENKDINIEPPFNTGNEKNNNDNNGFDDTYNRSDPSYEAKHNKNVFPQKAEVNPYLNNKNNNIEINENNQNKNAIPLTREAIGMQLESQKQKLINSPFQANGAAAPEPIIEKPNSTFEKLVNLKISKNLYSTYKRKTAKDIINSMNLKPSSYKQIGDFLFSHKLYDSVGENSDEVRFGRSTSFQIYNTTMNLLQFEKFVKSASSNTLTKLSQPYLVILEKIRNMFDKNLMNKADAEILRLRSLNIEQAADAIIQYSNNVQKESDYWFYYYIAANVILRGKIVRKQIESSSFFESEKWSMDTLHEYSGNKKLPLRQRRILPKGTDKYYDYFFEKDKEYNKLLDYFRKLTIYQLKNSTNGIYNDDLRYDSYLVKKNFTNHQRKKKPHFNVTWINNVWPLVLRKHLHISNFNQNKNLFSEAKLTPFYRIMKKFPKGIIHHLHWSAAFADDDIYDSIQDFIKINKKNKNVTSVIIKAEVYLRDRTRPNSFLEISSPRFLLIEDLSGFLNDFYVKKIYGEERRVFDSQYKLSDGRCIFEPFSESAKINADLKAFLFWRECNNSLLYNSENIESHEEAMIDISWGQKVLPLLSLKGFLDKNSHIIEEVKDLIEGFLPNSYASTLFNIFDKLSVAVWFKFEMIFGIYEALFDNDNLFLFLTKKLYHDLLATGVTGVEFRQGYDLHKNNSRVKIIKEIFYNNGTKSIPVSFILPGRKMVGKHKLRKLLLDLEEAKKQNEKTIAGFDFFGYEDDPFTGARNFFTLNLKDLDFTAKKGDEAEEDDFARMFRSLRNGNKLYLHAGETTFFPNYPVNNGFMRKFYINDNLIHAALLPNVARLGHGFAVDNNDLLMLIFRKKGIGLEICPTSNQALYYYTINSNPIVRLLRYGLSVSVSPDDPGLFDYSGVRMDWFNLIMHTDLKPSEYYILLRNSFLKTSIKDLNIEKSLEDVFKKLKKFYESYDLKLLNSQYYDLKLLEEKTLMTPEIQKIIEENRNKTREYLSKIVADNPYFPKNNNPRINIYNGRSIFLHFRKTLQKDFDD